MNNIETMKLARRALWFAHDDGYSNELSQEALNALRQAIKQAQQAEQDWSMLEAMQGSLREHMARIKELESQLAQQAKKPKYKRGDRLICLETEEYCVIHISGTDRQWVKFPDTKIGVYTNEQVAEMFELLPKEIEQAQQAERWEKFCDSNCVWTDHHPHCKLAEQAEPVAWWNSTKDSVSTDPVHRHNKDCQPLYTSPPPRQPEENK